MAFQYGRAVVPSDEIRLERAAPRVVSQTLDRLFLDLSDTFPCKAEPFTDFLER